MVRNLCFSILAVFAAILPLRACDVCGCAAGGAGFGLLSGYRYNMAGVVWYDVPFKSVAGFGSSRDHFYTTEVFVQYYLFKRWKLTAFQPYKVNFRDDGENRHFMRGFGDTKITGNYVLLDRVPGMDGFYWEIGAGLKLPVGKFDPSLHDRDLPDNFNLGTGSLDYIFQSAASYQHMNSSVSVAASYLATSESTSGYEFGDQLSALSRVSWKKDLSPSFSIVPNIGANFEWITDDTHSNQNDAHGTGGNGIFLSCGASLIYKNFQLGLNAWTPVHQHYADGETKALTRLSADFAIIF